MKAKRFITTMMLIAFFTTFLPSPLLADKPAVGLEQAIQTAKGLFPIPPDFNEFQSEFVSNSMGQSWVLRWQKPDGGSLEVSVDANSGDCVNMYLWRAEKPARETGKALTEAEAYNIAAQQLARMLPQKAASLRLIKEPNLIYLNGYEQQNYSFTWERYENGIPVLGDGVWMEIDRQTREIRNYRLEWLDQPLVKTSRAISSQQALNVFQNEKILQLEYRTPQRVRAYGSKTEDKPRLVYIINHQSNGTIDAITGKPQILRNGQWEGIGEARNEAMKSADGGMGSADAAVKLSPEEISELQKNRQFIDQKEAVARVKKWITIPADAILSNASLGRDWQNQDCRIWNLNWNIPANGKDEVREYNLWARVDALNGRIYSFHQYDGEQKLNTELSKTEAITMADSFIRQIEPKLAEQVKITEPLQSVTPIKEGTKSQWDFKYTRLVNKVPFPQQGINITVSKNKVTGYDLNWSEYDFPSADRAITFMEANRVFSQNAPLTLCYIKIYQENRKPVLSLVYKPLPSINKSDFAMIDAIDKEALDAAGTPLANKPGPRAFIDIKGHYAEKEINLIGSAGLMVEYDNKFRPEETIDNITFLRALLGVKEGIGSVNSLEDAKVISICQQRGWVKETVDTDAPLTREYMSRVLVRSMGLERVAENSGIFAIPYPDDISINKTNLGYVALVNGLGLIHSEGAFNCGQAVTRAEVAYGLIKSLNV